MGLLLTWVILVFIAGCFIMGVLKKQRFLCDSCRYITKRTKNTKSRYGTCSILGCPAYCDDCKYYEKSA